MREQLHPDGHRWVRSSVVDQEAIDHERQIGEVAGVGNDVVRVRVAQRVDFDLLADPVTQQVSEPRITLGETFELTPEQAMRVGAYLYEAADLACRLERIHWGPWLVPGREIRRC